MKKAIVATAVVITLGLGFAAIGEGLTVRECIRYIQMSMNRPKKKMSVFMTVGTKRFSFHPYLGHIKQGRHNYLMTAAEAAAWEPLFQNFRAAAIAKVKVTIWYYKSTKWVHDIAFNYSIPCK